MALIPTDRLFNRPSREEQRSSDNAVLKYEAKVIREEMVGYIDAILQRQDESNLQKRMETFQVENAARRSLKELMNHFEQTRMDSVHKISELQRESANQKRRIDNLTTQCKGFERDMQRVDSLAKDVH